MSLAGRSTARCEEGDLMEESTRPPSGNWDHLLRQGSGLMIGVGALQGLFVGGIAGVVLGLLLLAEWPGDAVWALGLLLGVDWLVGGMGLISLGTAARRLATDEPA